MTDAVPVLEYLRKIVGSHQFSGEGKEYGRSNFECEIPRSVVLECRNGNRIAIPTGSTLVVYRNPARVLPERMTIACFHHCGGKVQTVVLSGGRMRSTQIGQAGLLDKTTSP